MLQGPGPAILPRNTFLKKSARSSRFASIVLSGRRESGMIKSRETTEEMPDSFFHGSHSKREATDFEGSWNALLCRSPWFAPWSGLGHRLERSPEKAVAFPLFGLSAVARVFAGVEFGRHDGCSF